MSENDKSVALVATSDDIRNKIYTIRGVQVMLDSDLAEIYGYDVKAFNQQVKRNRRRFPEDFMFELTTKEIMTVKSQNVASRKSNFYSGQEGGRRKPPYAFTEQGIYMLASVLHGELAEQQSIYIMRSFKIMRHYLADNALVFQRLDRIETKQLESDKKFEVIFEKLEEPREKKAVLFFQGQLYDAFSCIADIIHKAKSDIILIDGYVATATLDLLSKKRKGVTVEIYTSQSNCKLTETEIADFNKQYGGLSVSYTTEFHDRFMILDKKTLYLIGASIKDAGKKTFAINQIEDEKHIEEILRRL